MTTDRVPVEGITINREPNEHGWFVLYGPSGEVLIYASQGLMELLGIPIADPPFVDPLGIGLTRQQCDDAVRSARKWPDDVRIIGSVGRALIAKGYTPEGES